ncbi:MAG: TIGR01244 family sulfur transferase [Sphingopyxis sp.]|jgi:uncharacterized protein (TIGR01244 family)|nr:TIGR01244 family sulfur transferase [Sphingopyxis sp.]
MFRLIADDFFVAPQIDSTAVAQAAANGVRLIVNNRPDGEELDAPQGAEIAAAAAVHGIAYIAIPVTHAGFSHAQLDALDSALTDHAGPVLAYCRSGTRSTYLWALVQARRGVQPDALASAAMAAGYDLSPIRAMLDALSGGAAASDTRG